MNVKNLFLNLKGELTFGTGVGISTAGLWLSLLCQKRVLWHLLAQRFSALGTFCVLRFYLSKRRRDFLWGLGGDKNPDRVTISLQYKAQKDEKTGNGCLFFFSSGNWFFFSSSEEKQGLSLLPRSGRTQAIDGLTNLTASCKILCLYGIETLSISSRSISCFCKRTEQVLATGMAKSHKPSHQQCQDPH